jgi:hypothetical protein
VVGLGAVVELLQGAGPQFPHHRPRVEPRDDQREQPGEPLEHPQIRLQGLVGARVLDLDRDGPPLRGPRPVHLPDARRGRGHVVELGQPGAPLPAQLLVEHAVHVARRERWALCLQAHQSAAIGLRQLGGHHRLVDGQRLADLHRTAAQLAEHGEQLLGVAFHHRGGHGVGVRAGEPPPPSRDRTAAESQRQGRHPGRARGRAPRKPVAGCVAAGPVVTRCIHVRAHHRLRLSRRYPAVPQLHMIAVAGVHGGPLCAARPGGPWASPRQLRRKASTASTRRLSSGAASSPSLVNMVRT